MAVVLKRLVPAELDIVAHLRLGPGEEEFAGKLETVLETLRTGTSQCSQHPFAILEGDRAVGFLVLKEDPALPAWSSGQVMTLHNFRIGAPYQGKGYGRAGIALAVEWIRLNRPKVERLMLAVNVRNRHARAIYLRCGFANTGALHQGPIGRQAILAFDLLDAPDE
jgi:RimJ/RimL family protein N-acetyltransferase